MSAITRDRLKEIFESGELDVTARTKKIKEQEAKLKAQEARIAELELIASTIKPKKSTRAKKTMSDEDKQALKDRLALGRAKKKAQESGSNSIDLERLITALKPEPAKAKEPEPVKAKEPEPKPKEPEPAKAKEPEPAKAKEPEPAKAREPEQKPAEQPPSFTKYKAFLKNAYRPKYY